MTSPTPGAQTLAERLTSLQRLVSALSRALTVEQVTKAVVTTATADLRYDAALVALLDDDGDGFEIVANAGYSDATTAQWRQFPLDAPLPAGDAIRTGDMVVLESLADRDERYPTLRGARATHETNVVVPLIVEGRPLGIVSFASTAPRAVPADEREFVRAVTEQCAQAVHRARLYEQQQRAAELQAFLARASRRLARSLAVAEVADELADVVVPEFADGCAVHLVHREGLRLTGLAHVNPQALHAMRTLTHRQRSTTNPWFQEVVASGEPRVVDLSNIRWEDLGAKAEQVALLRIVNLSSLLVVPLKARGRTIGLLTLGTSRGNRPMRQRDIPVAVDLASYAALALDNAMLFEQRSDIATTLQLSLLPPALPDIPGLELGASYRAAGSGAEVGGDFYDVFQAGPDRWVVVLGDVRGRGTQAAAITGVARHTLRAVGVGEVPPSEMVAQLNRVLLEWLREHGEVDPRFCAVNVVVLQPSTGAASLCCAGNPLPLLVRAHGGVQEVGEAGTVAGVVEQPDVAEVRLQLSPGDLLVGYTDGIAERGGGGHYFDERLPEVVRGLAQHPAQQAADGLRHAAESFTAQAPGDDMAVMVVRYVGPPA